jgi:hypothetical protein
VLVREELQELQEFRSCRMREAMLVGEERSLELRRQESEFRSTKGEARLEMEGLAWNGDVILREGSAGSPEAQIPFSGPKFR